MRIEEIIQELTDYLKKQNDRIEELESDISKWRSEETGLGKLEQMPDVLTAEEIAKLMRASVGTVYRAISEGRLKAFRAGASGKAYRAWKEDVLEYIREQAVEAPGTKYAADMKLKIIEKGKHRKMA